MNVVEAIVKKAKTAKKSMGGSKKPLAPIDANVEGAAGAGGGGMKTPAQSKASVIADVDLFLSGKKPSVAPAAARKKKAVAASSKPKRGREDMKVEEEDDDDIAFSAVKRVKLDGMKVADLKKLLVEGGFDGTGKKADLIERAKMHNLDQ